MLLAGVFAGMAAVLMVGFLLLCWWRYRVCVRRLLEAEEVFRRHDLWTPEELQSFYVQREKSDYREEAWYTRYHWCLFLTPIFLSAAVFCTVFVLTEDLHPWIHVPLTAVSAAVTLLGSGHLGYGIVRERVLPLRWW